MRFEEEEEEEEDNNSARDNEDLDEEEMVMSVSASADAAARALDRRRDALQRRLRVDVIKVAEEAARERGARITPQVAAVVGELTWTFVKTLAVDVGAFARHAKRSGVTGEDVLVAARRNPSLRRAVSKVLARGA